jgi:sodium-dependent dicarboxylate transporter 2/3/5
VIEAVEGLSAAEVRFERWRRTVGLFLGPAVFLLLWLLPLPALKPEAHRLASVVSLVVVWWITEPIPIPATALIGAALTVVCGVAPAQEAFAPFASPTLILFIGSFMIGRAVSEHQLDRRLAFSLLSLRAVRGRTGRIRLALGLFTVAVSAWMSNTATTAMMLPIAIGILDATRAGRGREGKPYVSGMLLTLAYGASIGGIMTPVGSPPNLITLGLLERLAGVRIDFLTWMMLMTPIALAVSAALFLITRGRAPDRAAGAPAADAFLDRAQPAGRWTAGQINCAIAFGVAVTLWVLPGVVALVTAPGSPVSQWLVAHFEESVVAVVAAGLLFLLPTDWANRKFTLGWAEAREIDWGTILLFGGGLSLGRLMFETGLAATIGTALVDVSGAQSLWAVTAVSLVIAIILTEITSNTAATNMLVPVVISICQAGGISPVPPSLAACVGASMAFMLPISTPPNAIVYGSGLVPITTMIRSGVALDVIAAVIVFLGLRILCPILGLA